jgi:hypothetical protein
MKTLRDLRRVGPVNPRVAGRARMDRGFRHAIEHMRLSGAMTPGFVADNETAVMRMHLDDIGSIIDATIADDDKAGLLMRTIGYALDSASGLGRMEGEHLPGSELRARRDKRRIPGLVTGAENEADAEERHQAMKEVCRANRSECSGRKLAKKICAGEFGRITDLSEERVRALISQWTNAGLQASS